MVVFAALSAYAARLQVDVDTTRLGVGQTVGVHVTVVDGVPTAVPRVDVPEGLTLVYANQVTNRKIANGHITRWTTYDYLLTGDREGDYVLGPFSAEVGTQHLSANGRSILVGPPPAPALAGPLRATQTASDTDLWEGQVVVWQYRVESKERWTRSPLWDPAKTPALVQVAEGAEEHASFTISGPDGNLLVDETDVAYRVVNVGRIEVGPALARVDIPDKGHRSPFGIPGFDPFARIHSQILSTEPVVLDIKALPPPPPTFTGLVGDFELSQELSSQRLGVDGTADWKVSIVGDGTLESFAFPNVAEIDGVRFYDQSPTSAAALRDGVYTAQGKFFRQIVATRPGIVDLPPTTLTWFSPTRGEYVSQTIDPPPIEVTGDVARVALQSFAEKEAAEAPEVVDGVRPAVVSGAAQRWRWMPFAPLLAAIPLLMLLVLAADLLSHWWRSRPRPETTVAPITPLERLRRLPPDPGERLATLDAALRDAVARRTGTMDREAAFSSLPERLRDPVRRASQGLEVARYGDGHPPADLERLVSEAVVGLEAR